MIFLLYKECTANLSLNLLFYTFLLKIHRFLIKSFLIKNLFVSKNPESYNSDRDRFNVRSI